MTARESNARPIFLFSVYNNYFISIAYHAHICKIDFFKHYITLHKFQFVGLFGFMLSHNRIKYKNSHSRANYCG